MNRSRTLSVLCLLPLALTACGGPGRSPEPVTNVITLGSLASGSRMSQVSSTGRSWSVELDERDLKLTLNAVSALFKDAKTGSRVNYQFDQATSTWTFLLQGGEVFWHGDEIRVGDTTYDLSEPGEYVFSVADWGQGS
jgi:hypothetical protein